MAEKIKLFLTRNRLFEFDNCIGFSAKYEKGFDESQFLKALKMLFVSNPVLSSSVELCEDGEAFVAENKTGPAVEFLQGEEKVVIKSLVDSALFFSERLFSFYVINENLLLILGHTAVCDGRSLALLAGELISFYEKKKVSSQPFAVQLFSDNFSLPSNVKSPVIERLASDLEVGWQKKPRAFTAEDFKSARAKYIEEKSKETILTAEITGETISLLKEFCKDKNMDVSSVVAYGFYNALDNALSGKRKYKKLNVVSNSRVFFDDFSEYQLGAFDGVVTVALKKKKNTDNTPEGKVEAFHSEIYKRLTSSFNVFYNDYLQAKIPPCLCDSAYMYCAGLWNQKYSKRLALTYGCANEVMGEFSSYNFDQLYWKGVGAFSEVEVIEPLKMRSSSEIIFVVKNGKGFVSFAFKNDKIPFEQGGKILNDALKTIENIAGN